MRYLVIRIGGFGDNLVVCPLIRHLHEQGHSVVTLIKSPGEQVYRHNPHIEKRVIHEENIDWDQLEEYFEFVKLDNDCDVKIDLCESLETKLTFKAYQPQYNYPKAERRALAEKNMYEHTFEVAGLYDTDNTNWNPEMFFTDEEEEQNIIYRSGFIGRRVLVWGLSGSGVHKAYPHNRYVLSRLLQQNDDLVVITVGDLSCQILEIELDHPKIIHQSGKWTFRQAALMAKHASCLWATETGMTHAGGCFDTPKVIVYSHMTHEVTGKHFKNAYPIHPRVPCHPCFRLIDNNYIQCPVDKISTAPVCMANGVDPDQMIETLNKALEVKYAVAC